MASIRAIDVVRRVLKAQGVRWDVQVSAAAIEAVIEYGDERARRAEEGNP